MPPEATGTVLPTGRATEHHIICVDDDVEFLKSLEIFLPERVKAGTTPPPWHRFHYASNPQDALGLLRELVELKEMVAMIISDEKMPTTKGTELLAQVKTISPDTMRVLLTGHAGMDSAVRAINEHLLDKYLTKPIEDEHDFATSIKHLLQQFQMKQIIAEQNEAIARLYHFANSLNATEDVEKACGEVVAFTGGHLSCAQVLLFLAVEGEVRCLAHQGVDAQAASQLSLSLEDLFRFGILDLREAKLRSQVLDAFYIDEHWRSSRPSALALPFCHVGLFSGDEVLGLLHVGGRVDERAFSVTDLDLLNYIANTSSIGIHNKLNKRRLQDACRESRAQTASLAEAMAAQMMLEHQLLQAQKLESIGRLAAGIAHEINTPTQFVGDNIEFLRDGFSELSGLLENLKELTATHRAGSPLEDVIGKICSKTELMELDYFLKEIPLAIEQSMEGVARVGRIVKAMKEFSHPGSEEKRPIDLNRAIESTVTVARNEWKYVSDLALDLDPDLPHVPCLAGDFNQVMLNLIINSAQAISGASKDDPTARGRITISTRRNGPHAEIRISDTGTGIPEEIQSKVFDPFFTTKPVGQGTGQGLAIAHAVIVEKHQGTIHFETQVGRGTTFVIRLPLVVSRCASKDRQLETGSQMAA